MSNRNNTPAWDLTQVVLDGALVSRDGRELIFKRAKMILGASDDEGMVLVGQDHRAIATAEQVLREMGIRAKGRVAEGVDPDKAWAEFWSFRRGICKLCYVPQERQQSEQPQQESEAA